MGGLSRLRRLVVSGRWFFVACRLLPRRRTLSESEFAYLTQVIHERREISFAPCGAWARWGADFPTARAVSCDLSPATRAGGTAHLSPLHQTVPNGIQPWQEATGSPSGEKLGYLLSLIAREAGERW
jgi:hypothetical protein